ncbi:MAG: hypothetical protein JW779_05795 [Candidatus Thorarchaeota archaeon]|nr:hypothetical protein [Candidatus Thorarchaeota archaeon]
MEIVLFLVYIVTIVIFILPTLLFQGIRLRRTLQTMGVAVRPESKYETRASRTIQGKYSDLIQLVVFVIPIFTCFLGLILWPTILQEPISSYVTFLILFMIVIYLSIVPLRLFIERWVRYRLSDAP